MRKKIASIAILAFAYASAWTSPPAYASSFGHAHKHARAIPSIEDIVAQYADQISTAPALAITTALKVIAAPATFDAAGWTTKIEAANGTAAFVPTVVSAVDAAIAARKAAIGLGYVTVDQKFIDAAKAAKLATR